MRNLILRTVVSTGAALLLAAGATTAASAAVTAPAVRTATVAHAVPAAPAEEVVFIQYRYYSSGVACDTAGELMYGAWYGGGQVIGWDCSHLGKAPLAWLLTLEVAEGMCPNAIKGAVPGKCQG